jgi:hypothetical protein
MYMGAVSYKDMFAPLPSPPKCDKESSWPACATSSPLTPPPPIEFGTVFSKLARN